MYVMSIFDVSVLITLLLFLPFSWVHVFCVTRRFEVLKLNGIKCTLKSFVNIAPQHTGLSFFFFNIRS